MVGALATASICGMLAAAAVIAPAARAAGDRVLGRHLAEECASCHQDGSRRQDGMPVLAGMPEDQFVALMRAYRDKVRDNQVMAAVAARLAEDEIAALAAYYAALKPDNGGNAPDTKP